MKLFTFAALVALFALPVTSLAATPTPTPQSAFVAASATQKDTVTNAFHYFEQVTPQISVPTVIEVPLNLTLVSFPILAVYNVTTSQFEPYLIKESVVSGAGPIRIDANGSVGSTYAINDNNYQTYLEFPLHEGRNHAELTLIFTKPVVASSLSFALDANVALPQTISVTAETAQGLYTALAPTRLSQMGASFPQTTALIWHIAFEYAQPLRFTELKLNQSSIEQTTSRAARFLAQPGQSYQLYFAADRFVQTTTKEAGDLSSDKGVSIYRGQEIANPSYTPADADTDGIPDLSDNCVTAANADQKDSDSNGRGDACEDFDRDSIIAAHDNCADMPNQSQVDTDADGIGDVCDSFDNRVTERLPWLPWAGVGVAALVLLGLFALVLKYQQKPNEAA